MNSKADNRQGMCKWYAELFYLANIASEEICGGGPKLV